MRKFIFLSTIIAFTSCSRVNDESGETVLPNENKPPEIFTVKVSQITSESATITWDQAKDPENDEVTYDLSLNGKLMLSGSNTLELKIDKLNELTNYTGEVTAKDKHNNSTKVVFMFSTLKFYLEYLKKYRFAETEYGGLANQILKLRDDSFLILGMTRYQGVGRKLNLIKIDKLGNEVWNKMLSVDYTGDAGGFNMKMIQCIDSDNIIIGAGANVSKVDFNGNLIWVKNIPSYNVLWTPSGIESLVEDANHDYYVVGNTKSTDSHKLSAGHLTKLSKNGNIIFDKTFDNSLTTTLNDIIIDNNKLIILGTKEISGMTWEQYVSNNPRQVKYNVMFTDSNGNILKENIYNDNGYAFAMGIFKRSNNNYIFYGYSSSMNYDTNIYEINSDGNTIWENNYNYGRVASVKETTKGEIIGIGMQSGSYYTRTYIFLNDRIGNVIWSKNLYEMGNGFYGRDILPDNNDGGFRILITRDVISTIC